MIDVTLQDMYTYFALPTNMVFVKPPYIERFWAA